MRKLLIFSLITVFALTFANLSCSDSGSKDQANLQESSKPEKMSETTQSKYPKAPDFTLKDQNGNTVNLSDFKGKVVILDFWATWCGPCRMEIPGFVELYDQYKEQGLEIIGVSLDRDGWTPVRPFIKEYNIDYTIVLGNGQVVQAYGGINSIPTTFLINRDGEVVDRMVGYKPKSTFESEIANLL